MLQTISVISLGEDSMKKERESGLELFRIFCIIGITMQHMMMHTGALESSNMYIRIWAQFFNIFAKAGVNGFVMISAWFMGQQTFSYKRIFSLHKTVWFYSLLLGLIGAVIAPDLISRYRIIRTILPVVFSQWWFVTAFIGMLAFVPVMNVIIDQFTERQYLCLVITGLFLFSIIPTFTAQTPYLNNMLWFVYLYLLTNYIRKYHSPDKILTSLERGEVSIIVFLLMFLSTVVFTILERFIPVFGEGINFFTGMYILTQVIASLSAFLWFKNLKLGYIKWINWAGKHTFPVYLIQSNTFFTVMLWSFATEWGMQDTLCFPILVVISVLGIVGVLMLVSVPIELLYKGIWRLKPICLLDEKVEHICNRLDEYFLEEKEEAR